MRQLPDKPGCLNHFNLLYCLKTFVRDNSQNASPLPRPRLPNGCRPRAPGPRPRRRRARAPREGARSGAHLAPSALRQGGSHAKFHLEPIFKAGFIKYLGTRGFVVEMPGNPPVNYSRPVAPLYGAAAGPR